MATETLRTGAHPLTVKVLTRKPPTNIDSWGNTYLKIVNCSLILYCMIVLVYFKDVYYKNYD